MIAPKPSSQQVGGDHYKNLRIQPAEFIHRHNIPYLKGNVLKYVARHRNKNKLEDLKKAFHYLQLLREWQRPRRWWEKLLGLRDERVHWADVVNFQTQFAYSESQVIRAICVEDDLVEAEKWIRILARTEYRYEF